MAALLVIAPVHAQSGHFGTFRYDDDFTAERNETGPYASIKHIDLDGERRYLSLGGDFRERGEYYSNSNISAHSVGDNGFALHRLLMHADMHWDDARVFVQLGAHEESGREPKAKPTDVDRLDVQQAFIDYAINTDGGNEWLLRLGRQEMAYGASRLISVREGPNIHLSFDGARLQFKSADWNVSAFAVRPVEINPGAFDDPSNPDQSLWGVYATTALSPPVQAQDFLRGDFYYFGNKNNQAHYQNASGQERRNTFGTRFYGRAGAVDGDIELIAQGGSIEGQTIRAFAVATDTGWTFESAFWTPRIGLRTDVISGDRRAGDGKLNTFNALYPSGSYFSEASLVAQANLLDYAASVTVHPMTTLSLALSYNPLWRFSTSDAVYSLPLAPLISGTSSASRSIGTQTQLLMNWQCTRFVSFKAALVRFDAGEFVERAHGKDVDYAQIAMSARF